MTPRMEIERTYAALGEDDQAFAWLEKLESKSQSAEDERSLADYYAKGRGVAQSDEKAAEWYAKAAIKCDPAAQQQLGLRYADGRGAPKDPVMAYFLLTLSMYSGVPSDERGAPSLSERMINQPTALDRAKLAKFMSVAQITEAEALDAAWRRGQPLPPRTLPGEAKPQ
jgi:TPR repeat protein